jgi:hypothetical protein
MPQSRAGKFLAEISALADQSLLDALDYHVRLLGVGTPIPIAVVCTARDGDRGGSGKTLVEGGQRRNYGRFTFAVDRRQPPMPDQLHAEDKVTGFKGAYQMPSGDRSELTKYPDETPKALRKEIEKRFGMKVESWVVDGVQEGALVVRATLTS